MVEDTFLDTNIVPNFFNKGHIEAMKKRTITDEEFLSLKEDVEEDLSAVVSDIVEDYIEDYDFSEEQ